MAVEIVLRQVHSQQLQKLQPQWLLVRLPLPLKGEEL